MSTRREIKEFPVVDDGNEINIHCIEEGDVVPCGTVNIPVSNDNLDMVIGLGSVANDDGKKKIERKWRAVSKRAQNKDGSNGKAMKDLYAFIDSKQDSIMAVAMEENIWSTKAGLGSISLYNEDSYPLYLEFWAEGFDAKQSQVFKKIGFTRDTKVTADTLKGIKQRIKNKKFLLVVIPQPDN
ncbi:MAG: hypothetical protein U9Q15_01210 [Patescibacteria group bacterium]|nr:hypothetical protein [Patescibacteria group bacterium]